ncbi:hypothetical protein D3C83_22520 [compost metagenome]
MPTARLGAPPVRDSRVASPICAASVSSCCGVTMKPHCATACAALSAVVPRTAGPTFIAKKTPGSSVAAAIIAITPTSDSISMLP